MSKHVHYLIEPAQPEDLPKIMHFLNWYAAMCFNRMLKRTGHFWEKRYYSEGFPTADVDRALNTLRYIHANPKAAGMRQSFFYEFSNYGTYERLTDDGLTQWHPAFLQLGKSLDECAQKYRGFCQRYKTKKKPPSKKSHWGNKLLAGFSLKSRHPPHPCQISPTPQTKMAVIEQFIEANQGFDRSVRPVGFFNPAGDVL